MQQKYNFFDIQKQITQLWESENIFQLSYDSKKKDFIIDTPPPTVSGNLHIGHIFSYIHQDIIARYKRMNNYNVIFPFGFDNNGLPTERFIEKTYNVSSKKMQPDEFINLCYQGIAPVQDSFMTLLKSLGLSYDWGLTYSTISQDTIRLSQKLFIDLYKKGYIYKKKEPALFCTAFGTSISQADLEEVEKETTMHTVVFLESDSQEKIYIATTRPELLGGCVAVLVNPEDSRYHHLIGKKAIVPFYNHHVPIIADNCVIIDKGTGVVMSATFGDGLDVYWFKTYQLPYVQTIHKNGTLTSAMGPLAEMKIEEGRVKIVSLLEEQGLLVEKKKLVHRVSIYERSKKEIEYIMLDQWFIAILPYKKELLAIAEKINWFPNYMKIRYIDWVKNLSWDWCISRQRTFGIPFPVWYDDQNNIILASENQLPVDPRASQPHHIQSGLVYQGDADVMDTWNTSSISPYIIVDLVKRVYGITINLPFGMRPQSHDIIRTWAFDTIVKAYFLDNALPWESIVISGHVITEKKEKISKSKENSPLNPTVLITQYPADVIRYWSATAKLGVDTAFSMTQFKDGNRLLVKLSNAVIFLAQYTDFATIEKPINPSLSVNDYMISRMTLVINQYNQYFDLFNFSHALECAEKFFWFFCDYYLEIMKLYDLEDEAYRSIKLTSSYLLYQFLLLFSPFIPFITEHIYQKYYAKQSFLADAKLSQVIMSTDHTNDFELVIMTIDLIRKAKTEKQISFKSEIANCCIYVKNDLIKLFLENKENIFIIKAIAFAAAAEVFIYQTAEVPEKNFFWDDDTHLHIYV